MRAGLAAGSCMVLVLSLAACGGSGSTTASGSGEQVYRDKCSVCHDSMTADKGDTHAPTQAALRQMPASRILRAMDFGVMMSTAASLTRTERQAVATYLGVAGDDRTLPAKAYCPDRTVSVEEAKAGDWTGWSPDAAGRTQNARYQASPGFTAAQAGQLKLKWVFGFDGDTNAFAPPAVLGRNLFVGSAAGTVHALDRTSGCVKWLFQADGPVRTAIHVVAGKDGKRVLLFGDQIGWFYAVDAESGKQLWRQKPEEHEATKLTGSAVVQDGIAYVPVASWEENRPLSVTYACCTFRGSVAAYRVADGTLVWKTYMIDQPAKLTGGKMTDGRVELGPSGAGVWSTPTVDAKRGRLYVTTGNNYSQPTPNSDAVVALELSTGKIVWSKQVTPNDIFNGACANRRDCEGPDFDFGSAAILVPNGKSDLLIAGQKSGIVYALDPDHDGAIVWQQRVGTGGTNGGVQWGMAADGSNVYAAVSDAVRIRDAVKSKLDPRPFGVDSKAGGGLTALRIRDGAKQWFAAPAPCEASRALCSPAQPAAVAAMPGVVFAGSVDGYLRAYSTKDGKVVWQFDTAKDWTAEGRTVNGVKAHGGAIDGAGPVVADGMVFVESGYSRNGGQGGNALLAFGIE